MLTPREKSGGYGSSEVPDLDFTSVLGLVENGQPKQHIPGLGTQSKTMMIILTGVMIAALVVVVVVTIKWRKK